MSLLKERLNASEAMMKEDMSHIDLENIDYDDVLHLYRGWRRSESELMELRKDYEILKEKNERLQECHVRFRGQILALESVKDFTVNLQSQVNTLQQGNDFLTVENKQFLTSRNKAEKVSQDHKKVDDIRNKALKDAQGEASLHRDRYQEMTNTIKDLGSALSNEIATKIVSEARFTSDDEVMDSLRKENSSLRLKNESIMKRMYQCDQELSSASQQLLNLSEELALANEAKEQMLTTDVEVGLLKGDISRLLRLMNHHPASKEFQDRWHNSDGMSFMGMGVPKGGEKKSSAARRNALGIDYTALGRHMQKVLAITTFC
jgi:chromosome segregation ATPase